MQKKYCCKKMYYHLKRFSYALYYIPQIRNYSTINEDEERYKIDYCPWCGIKLPTILLKLFYKILKKEYHIEDPREAQRNNPNFPQEFKSDLWWKKRNL
jgi:hypothetical protein